MSHRPFRFNDVVRLTCPTGSSATTLREFLIGVENADVSVIHHHLRETPLRFPHRLGRFPNDFALWAGDALENQALAERLAVLDPFHERDLEILREQVAEGIEIALEEEQSSRAVLPGREFTFSSSVALEIELGIEAEGLADLCRRLGQVPARSLFHHLYEARLRNPDGVDDISRWLIESLDMAEMAARLADLDIYLLSLEDCRRVVCMLLANGREVAS